MGITNKRKNYKKGILPNFSYTLLRENIKARAILALLSSKEKGFVCFRVPVSNFWVFCFNQRRSVQSKSAETPQLVPGITWDTGDEIQSAVSIHHGPLNVVKRIIESYSSFPADIRCELSKK